MKAKLIVTATAILISTAGLTAAAEMATGTVKMVDPATKMITLQEGLIFQSSMKVDMQKVGDKVQITYEKKDGKMMATNVKMAN